MVTDLCQNVLRKRNFAGRPIPCKVLNSRKTERGFLDNRRHCRLHFVIRPNLLSISD